MVLDGNQLYFSFFFFLITEEENHISQKKKLWALLLFWHILSVALAVLSVMVVVNLSKTSPTMLFEVRYCLTHVYIL